MFVRYLLVAALALPLVPRAAAQTTDAATRIQRIVAELEPLVEQAMMEGQIPSMTLALVEDDAVLWTGAYGYSNLWARTPAVPSTVYLIGSTYKAMSTMALMQLHERGLFGLDDPVAPFIAPMVIEGEDPERPITFRHLLTHTSGLPAAFDGYPVWSDTSPPALEAYLAGALKTDGPVETQVVYSNLAYALVGHLVERLSETPYRAYVQERLFDPMEMRGLAFDLTPEMTERLAIPYRIDEDTQRPAPATLYKASVWPAGIVYGTVHDLARWLIVNLNDGVYKGRRLLGAAALRAMHTRQYDAFKGPVADLWGGSEAGYGLTWWVDRRRDETYFAHSGSIPGYTAFVQGNRDRRLGFAVLTNGHSAHPHLIRLADQAMALMIAHPGD